MKQICLIRTSGCDVTSHENKFQEHLPGKMIIYLFLAGTVFFLCGIQTKHWRPMRRITEHLAVHITFRLVNVNLNIVTYDHVDDPHFIAVAQYCHFLPSQTTVIETCNVMISDTNIEIKLSKQY